MYYIKCNINSIAKKDANKSFKKLFNSSKHRRISVILNKKLDRTICITSNKNQIIVIINMGEHQTKNISNTLEDHNTRLIDVEDQISSIAVVLKKSHEKVFPI